MAKIGFIGFGEVNTPVDVIIRKCSAAEAALKATLGAIEGALVKNDKVVLVGFGTFKTKKLAARSGRNPATGDKIKIAASTVPTFKAGKSLKDKVNAKKGKKK